MYQKNIFGAAKSAENKKKAGTKGISKRDLSKKTKLNHNNLSSM